MARFMNGTDGGQFEKPSTQALTSSAGTWNRHAPIFWNPIELQRSPALAVHNGKLWLLYVGGSLELGYGIGDNDSFTLMPAFSANGTQSSTGPALIDLAGTLHCVFAEMDGTLVHYQYNDVDQIWGNRAVVYQGQRTSTDAALTVIDQNRLLCVFVPDGHDVYSSVWDAKDGWGLAALVNDEMTYGCPATYTLDANGTPQVFCVLPSENANRDLLSLTYDSSSNTWFGAPSNPPEATDFGVKGSSFNGEAFISFQERDGQGEALVISYQSGNWSPHEYTGELADDTPTVCAYNGVLNVMLNSKNTKSLIWISGRCTPGPHDSAVISKRIPFVECQTMTITNQLNSGIRYLDLRYKAVEGDLWMFHDIINLGTVLSDLLDEVWDFLRDHPTEAVIAQLKDEGSPQDPGFATLLFDKYLDTKYKDLFALGTTTPTLDLIRGKIQLIRRFASPRDIGLNGRNESA